MQENTQRVYGESPSCGENQEKIWYYEDKGSRKGPVSEREIRQLIESGNVSYDNYLWREGYKGWTRVTDTELSHHLNKVSPPPLLGAKVNNTFVWILAFAPVLGTFLQAFCASIVYYHGNVPFYVPHDLYVQNNLYKYWYITVILNILLCFLDARQLKKAGHDTSRFMGWIIFLIPVYIFKRANSLHQNKAYFITWLISFVVSILLESI